MHAGISAGPRRALGIALLVLSACHNRGAGAPAMSDSDVITRAEMSASSALNAYEVVQRLRPQFFASRGSTSLLRPKPTTPLVYLDDRLLGDPSYLRDIDVRTVFEIRYVSASAAQQKYGSGHPAGAILVTSARP